MGAKSEPDVRNIVSLFSGAGGFDYGLERTGCFRTKVAIESEGVFCETLRMNAAAKLFDGLEVIHADVSELSPGDILKKHFRGAKVDGLIGGPPCQSFSTMGKELGTSDSRGQLIFEFVRWAEALPVRFFIMENVPQLATLDGGRVFDSVKAAFEKCGFQLSQKIVNCADYGAATRRKRLFLVGVRDEMAFRFPDATHSDQSLPLDFSTTAHVTVADAFSGLPEPSSAPPGSIPDHWTVNHTEDVRRQFATVVPGTYYRRRRRSRLALDQPAPSLVAGDLRGIRSHIHPSVHRELTNRESARIQGFPDDFVFSGNHAAVGLQIANAVPIPVASAVAEAVHRHIWGGK